jgi:hypothetical protein
MRSACCDPVPFAREQHEAVTAWSTKALEGIPDPGTDDGWAYWLAHGWAEDARETAVDRYNPAGRWRQDADFIAAHWTPDGDDGCKCDAFDPATGLCGAHDARPPVCRVCHREGLCRAADAERAACLPSQCSYLADVSRAERPEGSRPLIPLTVL